MELRPGALVGGKYRVEHRVGEGGMGVVVAARHVDLDQPVAIKMLHAELSADRESVGRFMREARSAAQIRSEHVAKVFDVGTASNGTPFIVMELLEGDDLGALVAREGPLSVSVAVDFVLQACHALAEAHGAGIVHRDIKPPNLFLTRRPDGTPCIKLLDFGISKAETRSPDGKLISLTQTSTVMGSPQYMAPEQMRSTKRVDARADIWALGAVLHELLVGRAPYEAASMTELCAMILQDPPPKLSSLRSDVPEAVERVVQRCLQKDPADRYDSVEALAVALAPFATPEGHRTVDSTIQATSLRRVSIRPRSEPRPGDSAITVAASPTLVGTSATRRGADPSVSRGWIVGFGALAAIGLALTAWTLTHGANGATTSATRAPARPAPRAPASLVVIPPEETTARVESPDLTASSAPPPPSAAAVARPRAAEPARVEAHVAPTLKAVPLATSVKPAPPPPPSARPKKAMPPAIATSQYD